MNLFGNKVRAKVCAEGLDHNVEEFAIRHRLQKRPFADFRNPFFRCYIYLSCIVACSSALVDRPRENTVINNSTQTILIKPEDDNILPFVLKSGGRFTGAIDGIAYIKDGKPKIYKVVNGGGVLVNSDLKVEPYYTESERAVIRIPWGLLNIANGGGTHPPEDFKYQRNWPSGVCQKFCVIPSTVGQV